MVTDRVRRGCARPIGVLPVPEATTVVLKGTSWFRVCPLELVPDAVCGLDREVFTVLAKVVGLTVVLVVAVVALVAVVVDIFETRAITDADVVFAAILELPGLVVAVVVVEPTLDFIVMEVVVVVPIVLFFRLLAVVVVGLFTTLEAV